LVLPAGAVFATFLNWEVVLCLATVVSLLVQNPKPIEMWEANIFAMRESMARIPLMRGAQIYYILSVPLGATTTIDS
jgi:hypothetical protein